MRTLRSIRADIAAAPHELPAAVRVQVLWNVDKMLSDAAKFSASLSPLARAALMKALRLRFEVLLAPSFWRTSVKIARINDTF